MSNFRRRANILAILLLLVGLAVLVGKILLGREVLADSDILEYYYPVKTLIRNLFRTGHSLIWNPYLGEGQPLAANPEHEIFYPFTWLLFAMPVRFALALTTAAHLALTYWGMLRFLRRLRCSETAALFGAVTWTFGGLVVSSIHFYPILFAWTWIPWLCASAMKRENAVSVVRQGALFGGLLLLVGEPVTALLGVIAYAGVLLSERRPSRTWVPAAILAGLLAAGLGAASWIPGFVLAQKSIRGVGLSAAEASQRSLPPVRLAEVLVPRAFGDVRPHTIQAYQGWRLYPDKVWPFFWGLYCGALLIPLALIALLSRRRRDVVFGILSAFALAVSIGPPAGLWTFLRETLPGGKGVRFPEKFIALALFFIVILAARGLDELRSSQLLMKVVILQPFLIAAVLTALTIVRVSHASWPFGLWRNVPDEVVQQTVRGILRGASLRHFLLGVFLVGLAVRRKAIAPLFLLAAAADVLSASCDFVRTRPSEWMEAPPPVVRRILLVSPPPRLADFLPMEPPLRPGLVIEKNGPFSRNRILNEQAVQWGIPLAVDQDFDLTFTRAETRARFLVNSVALADHRALSGLLAARHIGALLLWNQPVTIEDPVTVVGVAGLRPEVDSAGSIVSFQGDEGFIRAALKERGDLRRAVFIEGPQPAPQAGPDPAELSRVALGDLEVSFDSAAPGPGLVRVARTNDGNWRARVDGKPWPVLTVNISMIGIALPPGSHHVVIGYRDAALRAGMGISAVSVIALAALFLRRILRIARAPEINR
jgi:hypothetical protein